ncbi:unnamed protein product [Cylindrotheca closterium]|uniref:Uncharacterized protein n=1 Tax=Cylindrotheca closterium TaxID=2856 RepID=A0AAD2FSX4_9STRA|nr:unnamed protein product [Cylindrotheca closterium]
MKPLAMKKKIVMKKSKKATRGKRTLSKGLPSFKVKSKPDSNTIDNNDTIDNDEHDDFGELPCDTILAFQSIQANSEGLHIPLLGGRFVQAVLETQLFQKFDENHASIIMQEVLELIQNGQLIRMSCHDEGQTAFTLSNDYIAAVWDAHQNHMLECRQQENSRMRPEIVTWFVSCLKEWKEPTISEESMEAYWKDDISVQSDTDQSQSKISFRDAVIALVKLQILMKVPISSMASESHYRFWLPQWGVVLKQWDKARRNMMACINRSSGGEISETNLLNFNRHSCVSTRFLLNDLVNRGKVNIVERPFGKFVRRVATSEH